MATTDTFNQIVSEKLDANNFPTWRFRMTNFLQGKGYWDYIDGDHEEAPFCPEEHATAEQKKALKDWNQGKSKVMYWLSMSVTDTMIGYLESATSPAIAWRSLERLNEDHTRVRKLQLKTELNTVKRGNMSITDYASKIKGITNSLGSIGVTVDDDDVVAATLEGLGTEYKNFKSSMNTRADVPDFTELTTMLICEEKSLGLGASSSQSNNTSDQQAFYSNRGRGRGRGTRGRRFGNQNQNWQNNQGQGCGRGRQNNQGQGQGRGRGRQNFRGRGRGRNQNTGASKDQNNASDVECWTCGEQGHYSNECPTRRRQNNRGRGRRQQNNYAATNRNNDDDRSEQLFVMQHMVNAMTTDVHASDSVWYVDSGASNHMTSHGEWFNEMKQLDGPGYVETGDDSAHPIAHVGKVPLKMQDGKMKYLANVLHVPNITKNLVSVGQMIEQGLQVRFNPDGCYVEDYNKGCKLITKGKRVGRMFTLDVNMPTVKAAMFAQGAGVVADIDIWHKRIGHVNEQRLRSMQSK